MQSKKSSALESLLNIVIGYCINFVATLLILPLFGVPITPSQNAGFGVAMIAVSFARSYCIRRLFNKKSQKS